MAVLWPNQVRIFIQHSPWLEILLHASYYLLNCWFKGRSCLHKNHTIIEKRKQWTCSDRCLIGFFEKILNNSIWTEFQSKQLFKKRRVWFICSQSTLAFFFFWEQCGSIVDFNDSGHGYVPFIWKLINPEFLSCWRPAALSYIAWKKSKAKNSSKEHVFFGFLKGFAAGCICKKSNQFKLKFRCSELQFLNPQCGEQRASRLTMPLFYLGRALGGQTVAALFFSKMLLHDVACFSITAPDIWEEADVENLRFSSGRTVTSAFWRRLSDPGEVTHKVDKELKMTQSFTWLFTLLH